jgi:hypothetical protein
MAICFIEFQWSLSRFRWSNYLIQNILRIAWYQDNKWKWGEKGESEE